MNKYYLFFIAGALISAFSQVLLKTGADKTVRRKVLSSFFNLRTIAGYALMFIPLLLSIYAMTSLPFKTVITVLPLTYVFVPIFSLLLLKEKISVQTACGGAIILAGIIIFNL